MNRLTVMCMLLAGMLMPRLAPAVPLTAARQEAKTVVIRTDAGAARGARVGGVDIFKGLPFAAPPLGTLRWRPPKEISPWPGVLDAQSFAPACVQSGVSMPGENPPPVSEDCLYLNIWAPSPAGNRGRGRGSHPVLVWIHGGGWTNGTPSMPLYAGDQLAQQGIVVVTIAYRLGVLGFLAHPDLSREGGGSSGNYGLQDQIAALQWVQRHIGAFGGDPGQVTVAGQSAGAMSVSLLIASPRAQGLFQRAIAQSGGVFEPLQIAPGYLLAQAERSGQEFAQSFGANTVDELRALPAARLVEAEGGAAISHPVIEPQWLPQPPFDAYQTRQHNDVPLLLGSNAEEGRAFVPAGSVKAATFEDDIARRFGRLPPTLLAAYPAGNDDEQAVRARLNLETDLRFGWNMWAWARLQAEHGRSAVFYYQFAHRPPFPTDPVYAGWGASHFAELWYVFGALDQQAWPWSGADRALSDAMMAYWVQFVRSGDPNHAPKPAWPRFAMSQALRLRLGWPMAAEPVAEVDRLRAIDDAYSALRRSPMPQR